MLFNFDLSTVYVNRLRTTGPWLETVLQLTIKAQGVYPLQDVTRSLTDRITMLTWTTGVASTSDKTSGTFSDNCFPGKFGFSKSSSVNPKIKLRYYYNFKIYIRTFKKFTKDR